MCFIGAANSDLLQYLLTIRPFNNFLNCSALFHFHFGSYAQWLTGSAVTLREVIPIKVFNDWSVASRETFYVDSGGLGAVFSVDLWGGGLMVQLNRVVLVFKSRKIFEFISVIFGHWRETAKKKNTQWLIWIFEVYLWNLLFLVLTISVFVIFFSIEELERIHIKLLLKIWQDI